MSDIGIVWRYQDPKNFYFISLRRELMHTYKVVDGVKSLVEKSPYVAPKIGEWHTLRVEFTGQIIKAFWNGCEIYTMRDKDILGAGAVGVLTNQNQVTYYDNVKYGVVASAGTVDFEDMEVGRPPPAPWKYGSTTAPDPLRKYPACRPEIEIVEIRYEQMAQREKPHTLTFEKFSPPKKALMQFYAPPYGDTLRFDLDASPEGYNWCVKSDTNIRDGYVEVEGKFLYGNYAQSIAVIWRFQDEKHYYVTRVNADTESIRTYKIVDGIRITVEGAPGRIYINDNQWYLLRVDFSGDKTRVLWNGREIYRFTDDTFTDAGCVGVWTKWDSLTFYDNFSYGGTFEE